MTVTISGFDDPFIRPLLRDLESLGIGAYLGTNEFSKFMLKNKLHKAWDQFQRDGRNRRTMYFADMYMSQDDNENALSIMLNRCYNQGEDLLYQVATIVIKAFLTFKNDRSTDLEPLLDTMVAMEFPEKCIDSIKTFAKDKEPETIPLIIPEVIADAAQLEDFLTKLNQAISDNDHNLALTYAYTCLEGVFKAYFKVKMPSIVIPIELQKQAAIVRDDIKKNLENAQLKYPEQILTLTATITSAVGNARNGYSVSHYDAKAEKWLAEFARDCTNSVARMILHFIGE